MKRNTTPQTEAISRIDTSGNMIPVNWYKTIQKQESKSGKIARKPHLLAINILADIVYWYKNAVIRDEITAEIIEVRKRFAADLLQRSYASIVNMFGCSDKDAREAVAFLESLGLITRVFRNLPTPNGIMPNVMYINVHAKVIEIATITNTPLPQVSETSPQNGGDVPPKEETCTDEIGDYTDTTTKTTNETTKEETSISFPKADKKENKGTSSEKGKNNSMRGGADEATKQAFEEFRVYARGLGMTARGLDTEFENFVKKHPKEVGEIAPKLLACVKEFERSKTKNGKVPIDPQYMPSVQTWINQKRWEAHLHQIVEVQQTSEPNILQMNPQQVADYIRAKIDSKEWTEEDGKAKYKYYQDNRPKKYG